MVACGLSIRLLLNALLGLLDHVPLVEHNQTARQILHNERANALVLPRVNTKSQFHFQTIQYNNSKKGKRKSAAISVTILHSYLSRDSVFGVEQEQAHMRARDDLERPQCTQMLETVLLLRILLGHAGSIYN